MSSNRLSGIDVSKWQGRVDWTSVQQSGIAFAFVRATYGSSEVDSSFNVNWEETNEAGIIRGAYHFFLAADDPVQQAEFFVRTVGTLKPNDLPPVVDVESDSGVSSNLVDDLQLWLTTVAQGLGRTPIIYTAPSYWNENLTSGFGHYPLWVAEYGVASPKAVNGWDKWTFWQYSSTGKVNGVSGAVDLDYFDDSSQTLAAFISSSIIPAGAGQSAGPASG
jgi:lysozyme